MLGTLGDPLSRQVDVQVVDQNKKKIEGENKCDVTSYSDVV